MTDPELHRCAEPGCHEVGEFGENVFGLKVEGDWRCRPHWHKRLAVIQKEKFTKAREARDADRPNESRVEQAMPPAVSGAEPTLF